MKKAIARKKDSDKFTSSILLKVTKEVSEEIKGMAKDSGMGTNAYIRMAVNEKMKRDHRLNK